MRSQQFIVTRSKLGGEGEKNTACHLEGFTGEKNEKAGAWEAGFVFERG